MRRNFVSYALLALALLMAGCASRPQLPVSMNVASVPAGKSVGIAISTLPAVGMEYPGAHCLLCKVAAAATNVTLADYASTLSLNELASVKNDIAAALSKKGIRVVVIPEPLDLKLLADAANEGRNLARKDFRPLGQKYGIDKLVVIDVAAVGFHRSYSAYIPVGVPVAFLQTTGYMVDVGSNTYEWLAPVNAVKPAEGPWDEPPKFPGLTNAYYTAIELAKERLVKPFSN